MRQIENLNPLTATVPNEAESRAGITSVSGDKCPKCGCSMFVTYGPTSNSGHSFTIRHNHIFEEGQRRIL